MNDNITYKLKPCPFCGSTDVETIYRFDGNGSHSVMCQRCGAQSAPCDTEQYATEKWNTRVEPIVTAVGTMEKSKK